MHQLVESDTSSRHPYPEVSSQGFILPRGVRPIGEESIARHIPIEPIFSVGDGNPEVPVLTDFMRGVGWLIVSPRLRASLDAVSADVEYVAVRLKHSHRVVDGYFIANPRRRVIGVDMQASSIELDEVGIALSVERLVLDQSKFNGIPLSVLAETGGLVASQEAIASITHNNCTGCRFLDPVSVQF